MSKKKRKKQNNKKKPKPSSKNIFEIEEKRTGGQVALAGFSYQCLYSCYIVLKFLDDDNKKIRFEGIEDIDIYITQGNVQIEHTQLKYSDSKQDASFLKDVLKNYLEVYLHDKNRSFRLVYDFSVAKGNLKKLIEKNIDEGAKKYWNGIKDKIKSENTNWNWEGFNIDDFFDRLEFSYFPKANIIKAIEHLLINNYKISTGNERLYANALLYICFNRMKERSNLTKKDLDILLQEIEDDINRGTINPAYQWIEKIDYNNINMAYMGLDYYEGKHADPSDIINKLPVRRKELESRIEQSINCNTITVIKSSSGQGKTTLALQVAYNLKDEFNIYQLSWCSDSREIDNIIEFFKSRIKIGEKILILLDNLDGKLKDWNSLAQQLRNKIGYNYKLLLTTREDDWYTYSGDQSKLKGLEIVNIYLKEGEAEEIFNVLRRENKINSAIKNWQNSWEEVYEKKLLIEYVFLLTQGKMLTDRITEQIKMIQKQIGAKIKLDILRVVCLADTFSIKLLANKLVQYYDVQTDSDIGEILKSVENEFHIKFNEEKIYIEGLHPVRSQHIVDRLHEYNEVSDTVLKLIDIVDENYVSKLYSYLPSMIKTGKQAFYKSLLKKGCLENTNLFYYNAILGIYTGSILYYYQKNKEIFDDANNHGGLKILLTDINPFNTFTEFETEITTLEKLNDINRDNKNIEHLISLKNKIDKIAIKDTDFYFYAYSLHEKLENYVPSGNYAYYIKLVYWLIHIDRSFNQPLFNNFNYLWNHKDKMNIEDVADLMYCYYLGNREQYNKFSKANKSKILLYLKKATRSVELYEDFNKNEVFIRYLLSPSEMGDSNEESMKRINIVCKMLPIYQTYNANAIKINLDIPSALIEPDNSIKSMPISNVIISFHKSFIRLWTNTILSNYESSSIYELIDRWIKVRGDIVSFYKKTKVIIQKKLCNKSIGNNFLLDFNRLRETIEIELVKEQGAPYTKRPFQNQNQIIIDLELGLSEVRSKYFSSVRNFINQVGSLLSLQDDHMAKLAIYNLRDSYKKLAGMQRFFEDTTKKFTFINSDYAQLCRQEDELLSFLVILSEYYASKKYIGVYNKKHIEKWYFSTRRKFIMQIKEKMEEVVESRIKFDFPIDYYEDGNDIIIPIVANNWDIQDENQPLEIIKVLMQVSELQFDYVIVLRSYNKNMISSNGFQFSKNFLMAYLDAYRTESYSRIKVANESLTPQQIDIGSYWLKYFSGEYILAEKQEKYNFNGELELLFLLWKHSQYSRYITSEEEQDYLNILQKEVVKKFENKYAIVREATLTSYLEIIENYKTKVFNEDYNLDESVINSLINRIADDILSSN